MRALEGRSKCGELLQPTMRRAIADDREVDKRLLKTAEMEVRDETWGDMRVGSKIESGYSSRL